MTASACCPFFYHLRDASVILWSIYVLSSLASMQRLKSFSPAALPADATKVTALKANTVPKGRTTTKKRRMHKQDGKSYALTIDLHTILRMSFTLVAIFCCVFAYRSLSSEVNKVVEIQESQPESIRRLPRNHNEDEQISSTLDLTKGKERILQLLKEAGIFDLDDDTLHRLPTWDEVISLYGPEPVIYGLDTCEPFRESSDPADHFLGVAGTFNTGTNLLSELLIHNCHIPARMAKYGARNEGVRWQVPWGKHTPVYDEQFRQTHKASEGDNNVPANNILPAIAIRDPAVWAASMCRNEYAMEWTHTNTKAVTDLQQQHCPNLVPNVIDIEQDESLYNSSTIPVSIQYAKFNRVHDSMIAHWNEFYKDYYQQNRFPRVMVRFEDLVFHPKQVIQTVCECAGGTLKHSNGFQYIVDSAKITEGHGKQKTGYVDAIIRYGSTRFPRWYSGGMTDADRQYVVEHLDPDLMGVFRYRYPDISSLATTIES